MKSKSFWTGMGASVGMLILILDSRTALQGAQRGVELCVKTAIPSLFPFFVLSILLTGTMAGRSNPVFCIIGRLFSLPEGAEPILVCGLLGGYPVGAQAAAQAVARGQLSEGAAARMLAYCSNAGPAFLFGIAASLFDSPGAGWWLWGIHIAAAWLVSQLFPLSRQPLPPMDRTSPQSMPQAVQKAISAMASVCGWIILFRVILAFLDRWALWMLPEALQVYAMGLLELTNGCCTLSEIPDPRVRFFLCSGMLGFGGVCVLMQTRSVTQGLSLKYYIQGKLLQMAVSLLLAMAVTRQKGWLFLPAFAVLGVIFRNVGKKSGFYQRIGV